MGLNMTTDHPTSAGQWEYTREIVVEIRMIGEFRNRIDRHKLRFTKSVTVTETSGAGRLCRELQMGGHALCGFKPWSGQWRKAA